MGMMETGDAYLAETLLAQMSQSVTYTRGRHSATVTAIVGRRTRREGQPPDAKVVLGREPMDFRFDPAALVVNGATITPQRGDRITWAGRSYDVQPLDGEPAYRPSGSFGNLILVHTLRA